MDSLLQLIMRLPMWAGFSIPFFLLLLVLYFALNKVEISRSIKHSVLTIVGTILLTPMPMGMFIAFVPNGYLVLDIFDGFEYYNKVWDWLLISGLITFSILSLFFYKILPSDKNKTKQDKHSLTNPYTIVPIFILGISIISMFIVPQITRDKSCHNPLRDGGTSISPALSLDVKLKNDEWPELTGFFIQFSQEHSLDFENSSDFKPDSYKTLYLSMCHESGFQFGTAEQRWASRAWRSPIPNGGVSIMVFEFGKDTNLKIIANDFISKANERWPGKVVIRSGQGYIQ